MANWQFGRRNLCILRRLVETYGPSGNEREVQLLFKELTQPLCNDVSTIDVLGNVAAVLNPEGKPRIMISAHADEIRLVVKSISDDGFVHLSNDRSFDLTNLAGRSVDILTKTGNIPGVIGSVSVHDIGVITEQEYPENLRIHNFWVDIGEKTRRGILRAGVRIGDPILISGEHFRVLRNNYIQGRCLDNRAGLAALVIALQFISKNKRGLKPSIYFVSSVQEENDPLLLMGIRTAAHTIQPDMALVIDVTPVHDYPAYGDYERMKAGGLRLGQGPSIGRGPSSTETVVRLLEHAARLEKIPFQLEALSASSGGLTEANWIQRSQGGIPVANIGIPMRYMHHPIGICSLKDIYNTAALVAAFVRKLKPDMNFKPW